MILYLLSVFVENFTGDINLFSGLIIVGRGHIMIEKVIQLGQRSIGLRN